MNPSSSATATAIVLSVLFSAAVANESAVETRLTQSLQHARHLATLTGKRAVLCPSADGRECSSTPDFSHGWIAFLDDDGNREHAASEALILAEAALPRDVRLRATLGRTRLVVPGYSAGFTLCDARGAAHARALILARDGQVRTGKPAKASVAATCAR